MLVAIIVLSVLCAVLLGIAIYQKVFLEAGYNFAMTSMLEYTLLSLKYEKLKKKIENNENKGDKEQ